MIVINSTDNFKIKELKKLHNKKNRDISNQFLIEGEHLVIEAFKGGLLQELIIEESYNVDIDIKKTYVSKKVISYLSLLESPSKVIGICNKKKETDEYGDKVLVLENIQDPGNLGTIIRSAYAFNVTTVVISEDTVDLYNEKVLRSSQGMFFKINVIRKNIEQLLIELRKKGYQIYGTDVIKGVYLNKLENRNKSVIIIGNEGQGIKEKTKELCDEIILIKMNEDCESLNASVAASIIMYEFNKD